MTSQSTPCLTPSGLCLLQLISLYCHNNIPAEGVIPVLSFLASQITPHRALGVAPAHAGQVSSATLSLEDFRTLLSPYKTSHNDSSNLWHHFITSLWTIRDIDQFFSWTERFDQLFVLSPALVDVSRPATIWIALSKTSLLGVFVRRSLLEFEQLQFHDVMTLWKGFYAYRAATADVHRPELSASFNNLPRAVNNDFNNVADDRILALIDQQFDDAAALGQTSSIEIERLLEFQIGEMQSA